MDRNALAVKILADALKGVIVMDRRKNSGHSDPTNWTSEETTVNSNEQNAE
jgi:hypothetical protein